MSAAHFDTYCSETASPLVLALSGGVGGAKLAVGLADALNPEQLIVAANIADDFQHLGLSISPDLDTVMYTLAGINDQQRGWGLENETWNAMSAFADLGGETWFQLGDRDLATHVLRTHALNQGRSLSEVTADLCRQLAVSHPLIPASDDPVRTRVYSDVGELAFQDYFVNRQCQPAVSGFYFQGIEQAKMSEGLAAALANPQLTMIIICPSNPFVSIDPILELEDVRAKMKAHPAPVIAISPIVAGMAIKGPAAKMMQELSMPVTAMAVAEHYGNLLDGFIIDESDRASEAALKGLGLAVHCTKTVMKTQQDKRTLAAESLAFGASL